ncbi:DUF3068 domain-containing protein [Catenulispora subtropica]|uniref:DUF3068 domain-containing protein n=1 Tax=Catenulispora subtropica TaxID=450798 RepID=A0ABN2SLZ8_9ACTN
MRRRSFAITAATAIAAFSFTLVPLLRIWVLPRVELAPLDIDSTDVSVGTGTYLDPATGKEAGPAQITITRHVLGDVADGEHTGYAVWDVATRTDTPATISAPDPRQAFSFSVDRWVFDRHTDAPKPCCADTVPIPDLPAAGTAYLKFPFELGKHDYEVWDATAKQYYVAHFDGTQTVDGRLLYRFAGTVPAVRIGSISVPGGVVGLTTSDVVAADEYYANPREITLVDPMTGAPIEGSSHLRVTLRAPGGTADAAVALDVDVSSTAATIAATSDRADRDDARLALVTTTLPLAASGLGTAAVLTGVGMAVRGRSRRPDPLPEPVEGLVTP